jgi:DNA mismatch endonuclease, patch repair protein
MADTLSKAQRSERMSRIRSRDTKPELVVRKALWAAGFRYRLHRKDLPGRPDIVLPGLGTVILVHGCYWHGHACQKGRVPSTNSPFWADKFARNKARDRRDKARLRRLGWTVVTVWECSLSTKQRRERALSRLVAKLEARNEGGA